MDLLVHLYALHDHTLISYMSRSICFIVVLFFAFSCFNNREERILVFSCLCSVLKCNFVMHFLNTNDNKLFISYIAYIGKRDN